MCHALQISSYGTREEKINRFTNHISLNENIDEHTEEFGEAQNEQNILNLSQDLENCNLDDTYTDEDQEPIDDLIETVINNGTRDSDISEREPIICVEPLECNHEPLSNREDQVVNEESDVQPQLELFVTVPKPTFLEKRKARMQSTDNSTEWNNHDYGSEFVYVAKCHVNSIELKLQELPFFQTIIGSHELKMAESSKIVNENILKDNNFKLVNVRLKKNSHTSVIQNCPISASCSMK